MEQWNNGMVGKEKGFFNIPSFHFFPLCPLWQKNMDGGSG
jgi:hypothetical protein